MNKLEEILRNHYLITDVEKGSYDVDWSNNSGIGLLKELSTLIQQERREAVEGFVKYALEKGYKVKGVGMSTEEITVEIDFRELVEQYLNSIGSAKSDETPSSISSIKKAKREKEKVIEQLCELYLAYLDENAVTDGGACFWSNDRVNELADRLELLK